MHGNYSRFCVVLRCNLIRYHLKFRFERMPQAPYHWLLYSAVRLQVRAKGHPWAQATESCMKYLPETQKILFLNRPDTTLNAQLHTIDSTFPLSPYGARMVEVLWTDWFDGSLNVLHFLWAGPELSSKRRADLSHDSKELLPLLFTLAPAATISVASFWNKYCRIRMVKRKRGNKWVGAPKDTWHWSGVHLVQIWM